MLLMIVLFTKGIKEKKNFNSPLEEGGKSVHP